MRQVLKNFPGAIHHPQRNAQRVKRCPDLLRLALAHQACIHKDGGHPVSKGAVRQQRSQRGIHAAAHGAYRLSALCRRLGQHSLCLLTRGIRRPPGGAAADIAREIHQDGRPLRVIAFQLKLYAIQLPFRILKRNGTPRGAGRFRNAGGQHQRFGFLQIALSLTHTSEQHALAILNQCLLFADGRICTCATQAGQQRP